MPDGEIWRQAAVDHWYDLRGRIVCLMRGHDWQVTWVGIDQDTRKPVRILECSRCPARVVKDG